MSESVIQSEAKGLNQAQVEGFQEATASEHVKGIPPTFLTRFREAEYEWLDRLQVDMRYLLHGDQEYEYLEKIQVGDELRVSTQILDDKERTGRTGKLRIVKLGSEFFRNEQIVAKSVTTFVVREPGVQ